MEIWFCDLAYTLKTGHIFLSLSSGILSHVIV